MNITEVTPTCKCGRKLAPVNVGQSATFVADRTCPHCHAQWRVIVKPFKSALFHGHTIQLTCTKGVKED